MLNSGKKICASCNKKNKYSNSVLSEKNFWNKTKNKNPPLQVKWSVPNQDQSVSHVIYTIIICMFFVIYKLVWLYNKLTVLNQ